MLHPIGFSIPESKIICDQAIEKTKLLSSLIPGKQETYIYETEEAYYNEYKISFFAITMKKSGWDCLRHYEIIANGCIPYFIDIDKCPKNTLHLFPKDYIKEGNALYEKMSKQKELSNEDIESCQLLISKLLSHTRNHLTTKKMAEYVLSKVNKPNIKRVLFLSGDTSPDYLRCLTLHGFKEIFGKNCHDYPKIPHIYKCNSIDYSKLYGKGISYTALLDPLSRNDSFDNSLRDDINNKRYDIVVYGSYHRGIPLIDLIREKYSPNEIVFFCGEDLHNCNNDFLLKSGHPVFVREQ